MAGFLVISVVANIFIFSGAGATAWSIARRNRAEPMRSLARTVSLVCWAVVFGSAVDLTVAADRWGGLFHRSNVVAGTWHLLLLPVVAALGISARWMLRRVDLS